MILKNELVCLNFWMVLYTQGPFINLREKKMSFKTYSGLYKSRYIHFVFMNFHENAASPPFQT